MDSVLIDIAIGLVLIYACLSLLLMKTQEVWHGGMLRGRVKNLHRLVYEAVGQDKTLREQLYRNPLILALSIGEPARDGHMGARSTGPSAIPPELFARALLMELNPSQQHPQQDHTSPLAFLDAIDKAAAPGSKRAGLIRGLRGLMAGNDGDWPRFEAAIAKWFADIGDRSEGWYKRRSGEVGGVLALALCVLLNVDTVHIANTLGADPELRVSLGRLGESVVREREGAASAPAITVGAAQVSLDAETRTMSRLLDAIARLRETYFRDKEIGRFGQYVTDVEQGCKDIPDTQPKRRQDKDEGRYLSNSDTWQNVLPLLLAFIEQTTQRTRPEEEQSKALRAAFNCLSQVSAWVRAAATASANADTRRQMQEAAVALEDSKAGLLTLIRNSAAQGNLRRLFKADPAAYTACGQRDPKSLSQFEECVRAVQDILGRLPLGHTGSNRRQQFCTVDEATDSKSMQPKPGGAFAWVCGSEVAKPLSQFGARSMALSFDPGSLLPWVSGILISALFISLGAPFWFDMLSKVVRVRNAGRIQDIGESERKGRGDQPLPPPSPAAQPAEGTRERRPAVGPGSPGTLPAVEGSSNTFEDQLLPREIIALQTALNVIPASGKLDERTREAIRRACRDRGLGDTDRLSLGTYSQLVGRAPVQARDATGPVFSSRPQLRLPYAQASTLGAHLCKRLGFTGRIPANETVFSDELRALAVLFRFKIVDGGTQPVRNRAVLDSVNAHPEQLDEVDDELLRRMLEVDAQPAARDTASPWMDWALGELGQVERNGSSRGSSNPRVCEYLDAAQPRLGDQGDTTPWCGAFVAWVLKQHNDKDRPASAQAIPRDPAGAKNWRGWVRNPSAGVPNPASTPPPQAGDVVVVSVGSGHHVGFVLEVDVGTDTFWMLGGNQTGGTRVSMSRWSFADLAT